MLKATTTLPLPQRQEKSPVAPAPARPTPDLTRWHGLIAELRNPDLELDCETFAGIWREYTRLKARGVKFDEMLVALLTLLSRQVMLSEAGVDDFVPLTGRAA